MLPDNFGMHPRLINTILVRNTATNLVIDKIKLIYSEMSNVIKC